MPGGGQVARQGREGYNQEGCHSGPALSTRGLVSLSSRNLSFFLNHSAEDVF